MGHGNHRFPYKWKVADLKRVRRHGHKVFSTFSCGGGSSFGYKMAGFDVIGCNEIDAELMELYKANHHPRYSYLEPIQDFKGRKDLPGELFDLDILDGSPPCSTFSMAACKGGGRENRWGKEKKFREGQAKQVLSDLFFDYLDVVGKLRPKVAIAENVKGLIIGKAKGYCKLIIGRFEELGYDVQLFLFNAAAMGVPQARERVFFLARRKDLGLSPIRLAFNEEPIPFSEVTASLPFQDLEGTTGIQILNLWHLVEPGRSFSEVAKDGKMFNWIKVAFKKPCPTLAGTMVLVHPGERRRLSWIEVSLCGSYPYDYDYLGKRNNLKMYCVGMSVPPVMTAQIAAQVAEQWFGVAKEQIDEAWR
jgi:DNA (cytosine-5)-methyltransferase 1